MAMMMISMRNSPCGSRPIAMIVITASFRVLIDLCYLRFPIRNIAWHYNVMLLSTSWLVQFFFVQGLYFDRTNWKYTESILYVQFIRTCLISSKFFSAEKFHLSIYIYCNCIWRFYRIKRMLYKKLKLANASWKKFNAFSKYKETCMAKA